MDGKVVTRKRFTVDYDRNQYVRAFFGTILATDLVGKDAGNQTDYWAFKRGYTLYAFDLTPGFLDRDQFEMANSSQ